MPASKNVSKMHCPLSTVNNFEFMYSRQSIRQNSFQKVHLYIFKVIYDIPARTTKDAAVSLWTNIIPKRNYELNMMLVPEIEPGLPTT
jgi:hypothetical protein